MFVLFLLVSAVLAGLRATWSRFPDPDPWARAARRLRPLLLEIEDELRTDGRHADADRIAACAATISGWEAPLSS